MLNIMLTDLVPIFVIMILGLSLIHISEPTRH